jgi:DNA-binding SARP family transcriptional activator
MTLASPAEASITQRSAVDQISREFLVRITNPADGVSLPSILFIRSAKLSTSHFDGIWTPAPKGKIYLTFSATSGPEQLSYGQANWGHFFSTMTPLVPSAVTFTTGAGQRYLSTRSNPVNQANNPNTNDDGLIDATYWFVVPSNTRSGMLSIGPATTEGLEYQGFVGQSPIPLRIAGPTSFKVSFPRQLSAAIKPVRKSGGTAQVSFSPLNDILSIISLFFFGAIFWKVRRRSRRRFRYVPEYYPPASAPESGPSAEPTPAPASTRVANAFMEPRSERTISTGLRVNVLGPLQINPSTKGASDPIRSILAYLAVHDDRPQSADEIQTALWPDSMKISSVAQKTFLNYVSRARQTVGTQFLPDASGRPGYELINTTSDWREFRTLATKANSASKSEAIDLRRNALHLVRGVPFEGETSTFFEWAVSQKYVASMIETVTSVAHQLQGDLILNNDLDGAAWAIKQALLLAPTELPLWRDLVDVCEARCDEGLMKRFWQDAERQLWPAAIRELQARLVG